MRGYEMVRRRRAGVVVVVTLVVIGVLLVFVSSAVAGALPGRVGFPLRIWSASKIEQGVGKVLIGRGRTGAVTWTRSSISVVTRSTWGRCVSTCRPVAPG